MNSQIFLICLTTILGSCSVEKSIKTELNSDNYKFKKIGTLEDSSISLNDIYIDSLIEVDSFNPIVARQKKINSAKYYYYAIKDTSFMYSIFLIYFNEDKEIALKLVNYSKNWTIIDEVVVSSVAGDGGCFFDSKGKFQNDSVIFREDIEGCYDYAFKNIENDSATIENYTKIKFIINQNGKIAKEKIQVKNNYRIMYQTD